MATNARTSVERLARDQGWAVHNDVPGGQLAHGGVIVAYERHCTQVLIAWPSDDAASWAIKNQGCPDQQSANGADVLVAARRWLREGSRHSG